MSRDQKLFDTTSLTIGIVIAVVLALFILMLKMPDITPTYTPDPVEQQARVAENIRPVGEVRLPADEEPVEAAPSAASEQAPEAQETAMTGEQVYGLACGVCHGNGIGGAPMLGDAEAWTARVEQGIDVLYEHAINGYQGQAGYMPPKGGNLALSDEAVRSAVDYLIAESD